MDEKKTAKLLIKLTPDLRDEFQHYAKRHGHSMSALIRRLLVEEMRGGRLVTQLRKPLVEGFHNIPAAEVQDDNGKLYLVQVAPFRSNTTIQVFDPNRKDGLFNSNEARGGSEMLDKVFAVRDSNFSWDSPNYRQLCDELGLDPDYKRPKFRTNTDNLVLELEAHIDWKGALESLKLNDLIFDLIDMLRIDTFPEFYAYERSKALLENWTFRVPKELFARAFNLVEVDRIRSSSPIYTSIDFLPSWAGTGYSASIGLYAEPDCASDGWTENYRHLTGIARSPDRVDIAMATVVRRLKAQGVTFLSFDEARAYMDGEGAYWAWGQRWSQCPKGLQPRAPSASEQLKWRIQKPALPLYTAFQKRQTL